MCILFIYTEPKPQKDTFRLIIASNRDEYYARPAKTAYLCPESNIIGGRDMEKGREGGMWLGVSLKKSDKYKFRFGALLNLTGEEHKSGVLGRGPIVVDYLKNDICANDYLGSLCSENQPLHNAFNFAAVELSDTTAGVYHHSNIPMENSVFEGPTILGFGNSTLESPLVKVTDGTEKFKKIVENLNKVEEKKELTDELVKFLRCEERHLPDPELQRRDPVTFEFLSARYVKNLTCGYGTRTHSIVLIDYDWNVDFVELTMEEPIDSKNPKWHLPDHELQRRRPTAYEFLSSIYVKIIGHGYGTRTHSIILVDYNWNVDFIELAMEEPIDPVKPNWLQHIIKAQL